MVTMKISIQVLKIYTVYCSLLPVSADEQHVGTCYYNLMASCSCLHDKFHADCIRNLACAKLKKIRDSPWRFMSMSLAEVSQPHRKNHLLHHCLRMGYTGIPYTPENGHEKWGTWWYMMNYDDMLMICWWYVIIRQWRDISFSDRPTCRFGRFNRLRFSTLGAPCHAELAPKNFRTATRWCPKQCLWVFHDTWSLSSQSAKINIFTSHNYLYTSFYI